jgi:hypothetical protein
MSPKDSRFHIKDMVNRFNRSSTSKNPACVRIESSSIHPSQGNQKGGELARFLEASSLGYCVTAPASIPVPTLEHRLLAVPRIPLEPAIALAVLPHLAVAIANCERAILASSDGIGAVLEHATRPGVRTAANAADESQESINREATSPAR